jgi:hypothetical protein
MKLKCCPDPAGVEYYTLYIHYIGSSPLFLHIVTKGRMVAWGEEGGGPAREIIPDKK